MVAKLPHNRIDAAAAEWVARLDRSDGAPEAREALQAWLDEDSRHYGAYVRASAAWDSLDRGVVLHPASLSGSARRFSPARRFVLMGGIAASAAAVALLVMQDQAKRSSYDTAAGEISRVALPDGSTAILDTDSRIDVVLSKANRTVQLSRGRVWFEVAKNKDWPFIVEAGPARMRAVGTAFTVVRNPDGAEVTVTEGVVDAWSEAGGRAGALRLQSGARARLTPDRAVLLASLSRPDLDRALAWRTGGIALQGETLAEASAVFNRYNARKIIIGDARLGARRLVGYFRVQDPQGFADAAAISLGAEVRSTSEGLLITSTER